MIDKPEDLNKNNKFLNILFIGIISSIVISFYYFYIKKDYDFYVETSCDINNENCFYRDCENEPDLCPPSGLSYYNQYIVKAKDFKYCTNEDCGYVCKNDEIKCVKIECSLGDINNGICVEKQDGVTDEDVSEI